MRNPPTLAALGLLALGACSPDRAAEEVAPTVVTFTATDFAYSGLGEVPAGTVTFRMVNQGTELHHAVLARLAEGSSLQDVLTFYTERRPTDPLLKEHPTFLTYLGGPNVGAPGSTIQATAVVDPGEYVLICYIESPDGSLHFMKGMTTSFTVTPSDAPAPAPTADLELTLADYQFTLSQPLTAGTHTLRVTNRGPQIHDVELVRLEPGATPEQFLQAMAPGSTALPPGELLGGLGGISPGETAYWTISLEPGNYMMLCFVPDRGDGAPHFAHGMIREFTIG